MWIPDRWQRSLLIVALCALATGVVAEETYTVKAVMILASDEPAPIDPRLERIEFRLRRIFKFEHYLHFGEASAVLTNSSSVTMDLGHGYQVEVTTSKRKKRVRTRVRWVKDDATLVDTSVFLKKNVPTILGGVPHEGGQLIIALTLD
jgi:hypothetical protein